MKRTKRIQKLVMLIPLLLIVCFVIFPYIWTFLTSIKPTDELYTTNIKNPAQGNDLSELCNAIYEYGFPCQYVSQYRYCSHYQLYLHACIIHGILCLCQIPV